FQPQLVNGYHTHWVKAPVPTVVPRITYKEETSRVTTYVHVPRTVEQRQTTVAYVPAARLVEKDVVTTVKGPIYLTDPAGKVVVSHRIETKTHRVSYPVYEFRPVIKEYTIEVTKMVPEERVTEYKRIMPIVAYDQVMTSEWQPMMVPYQSVITVPSYNP